MYNFFNGILADRNGGATFSCFGIYHFIYMLLISGGIALAILILRKRSVKVKKKAINMSISFAFGLYVLDFFLMPFAYGKIDIEKLPFHICTVSCVLCFLSRHTKFFEKFKVQFALLGFISNLVYVVYPAGVGWYQIHPLSYRVYQTLLFHGSMVLYGMLVLIYDNIKLSYKKCCKDLLVLGALVLWAVLGNTLYNGELGFFNWFFVVRDPFYIIPKSFSPYVMPFIIIATFFAADLILYSVYFGIKKLLKNNFESILK